MLLEDEILEFYNNGAEKNRISGMSLERIRTQELILRHIPEAPCEILDIGGGAGIYSFWLHDLENDVHFIDPVPLHVEQAKNTAIETNRNLKSIKLGDARALEFEDNMFDVVLLLGPLYHLTDKQERIQSLLEAKRVLKRDGIVFCAGISRFTSLIEGFYDDSVADKDFVQIVEQDIACGHHCNVTNNKNYFTTSYFHHIDELSKEVSEAGFDLIGIYSVESFGRYIPDVETKMMNQEYKDLLLKFIRMLESEPSVLSMGCHIMIVGKK